MPERAWGFKSPLRHDCDVAGHHGTGEPSDTRVAIGARPTGKTRCSSIGRSVAERLDRALQTVECETSTRTARSSTASTRLMALRRTGGSTTTPSSTAVMAGSLPSRSSRQGFTNKPAIAPARRATGSAIGVRPRREVRDLDQAVPRLRGTIFHGEPALAVAGPTRSCLPERQPRD